MADEKPDYKVYRSRPRLLRRRDGGSDGNEGLGELRSPGAPPKDRPEYEVHRGGVGRRPLLPSLPKRGPRGPRRITPGRVAKWLAVALFA